MQKETDCLKTETHYLSRYGYRGKKADPLSAFYAENRTKAFGEQITNVFSRYDALLLPCSTGTAFRLGETRKDPVAVYLADIFTVFANLTGIPSISVPLFTHSNGIPFSVHVMADKKQEETLLQAARFPETLKNAD